MEILDLIEELEEIADRALSVPFTGKCMFSKDEMLEILQEIRLKLPDDLKQARWIRDERDRILQEAKHEAEQIIKNAQDKVSSMVDEHDITKQALSQVNDYIDNANSRAKEISSASFEYADNLLENIEEKTYSYIKYLHSLIEEIRKNREELRNE